MTEWQPIETAPKNVAVLGWFPYYATQAERGNVFVMRWNDDKHGFWEASGWVWGVRDNRSKQPTHWMPLPARPCVEAGSPEMTTKKPLPADEGPRETLIEEDQRKTCVDSWTDRHAYECVLCGHRLPATSEASTLSDADDLAALLDAHAPAKGQE